MARHIHIHMPGKDSLSGAINKGTGLIKRGTALRSGISDAGTSEGAKRGHLTKRLPNTVKVIHK